MLRNLCALVGLALVLMAPTGWAADGAAAPAAPAAPAATALAPAAAAVPAEKLPIAAFAQLPFVENAEISPDGKHWAGLFGVQGTQIIAMIDLHGKPPAIERLAVPDLTEVQWLRWANDDNLLVGLVALQPIGTENWYIGRTVGVNRATGKATRLLWDLEGQWANDVLWTPAAGSGNEVLIAGQNSVYEQEDFWPAIYRVDVTTGHNNIVVRPHPGVWNWAADGAGIVRAGVARDDSRGTSRLLYRPPNGSASFRTVDRAKRHEGDGLLRPFMFLPGGDHALVIHDNDKGMSSIYEVDLATQAEVRTVFDPPHGEVANALVSADGGLLLGATLTDPNQPVHWFDAELAKLQSQFDHAVPSGGASIVSLSNDRRHMLVHIGAADMPGAMYYYDVDDGVLRKLALINELVGQRHLAPVKLVHYQARDGLDIEGVLTLPAGRAAHGLPFIVMPHGGPWAQDGLDYDYWAQFLANRGYAVLQPNFRGSTGYGTEFTKKGEGQLGLAMQDDVTDGVKWAIGEGFADPKRICIVGASYGGYAAMWGIVRDPQLYRCAISIAGVSNLRREVNDFGSMLNGNAFRDDWQRMTPDFEAVSPLNAVDRITTPLLLVHGKKDVTVDFVQSKKMYDRMRKASRTVEFVPLPLADHHFSRQEDRVALLTAMETFLAKYNPAD